MNKPTLTRPWGFDLFASRSAGIVRDGNRAWDSWHGVWRLVLMGLIGAFGLAGLLSLSSRAQAEPAAQARIVAADGAVTEILYALEAQDRLVGVDSTSRYPQAALQLPNIGYRRTLTAEGVLSLRPRSLIGTQEAGPQQTLDRLRQAGVAVHLLPALEQPEDLIDRVRQVALLVDARETLPALERELSLALEQVRHRAALAGSYKVLFLLAAGPRGVMVAGKNTQAHQLLDWLGLDNVAKSTPGYKPLNREALLMLKPQAIVVAETEPGAFREDDWPGLMLTEAGRQGRILKADSMYLLGNGPRLPQAMMDILDVVTDAQPNQVDIHD